MTVNAIMPPVVGTKNGTNMPTPMTTDEAMTNGLRRPMRSDHGPDTAVVVTSETRVSRPSTGIIPMALESVRPM
jgi:hypothetical protein